MSSVGGDGIISASPVLVILGVMEASAICTPVSNTINRLGATLSDTLSLAILVWALLSTQIRLGGDFVGSASLVLVSTSNMAAGAIGAPLALAIHWLTATRLGTVTKIVGMWAGVPIELGTLNHFVEAAVLILVILFVIVASTIRIPRANTVHWLRAPRRGALVEVVCVWASVTIVSSTSCNLVHPAPLVLMIIIMLAWAVRSKLSKTIHRLGAPTVGALLVVVAVRATISAMH